MGCSLGRDTDLGVPPPPLLKCPTTRSVGLGLDAPYFGFQTPFFLFPPTLTAEIRDLSGWYVRVTGMSNVISFTFLLK